jgi:L-asparaginase
MEDLCAEPAGSRGRPVTRPVVTILSLGGTIASRPGETGLVGPALSAADLVSAAPGLDRVAELRVRDLTRLPSCDLTLELAGTVAAAVDEAAAAGSAGVVVTQGTDTIEEMSFALDLLVAGPAPVAVTGAMRHAGLPGSDGPANLLDAVRTVASPDARDLGAVVVLNEEVHAARTVRKGHTSAPDAFRSPGSGPIGRIVEETARLRGRPYPRVVLARPVPGRPVPRPALVRVTLDDDGWWLRCLLDRPPPGLVVEGMGGGHVPGWLVDDLGALAARRPVLLASRTGDGEVLTNTYGGFPGSETSLIEAGLVPVGSLDGLKARVLLALLLADGADRGRIAEVTRRLGTGTTPGGGGDAG